MLIYIRILEQLNGGKKKEEITRYQASGEGEAFDLFQMYVKSYMLPGFYQAKPGQSLDDHSR